MIKPSALKRREEFIATTGEHLQTLRAALIQELASGIRTAHSGGGGESMDSADLASKELQQNLTMTLSARERDRIIEIDYALRRIAEGNYGVCGACGFEITELRLQAMPFTRHCRDCQQDQEREAKTRYRGDNSEPARSNEFGSDLAEEEIPQAPRRRSGK